MASVPAQNPQMTSPTESSGRVIAIHDLPAVVAVRTLLQDVGSRLLRVELAVGACLTLLAVVLAWWLLPLVFGWWDAPEGIRWFGLVLLFAVPVGVAAGVLVPLFLRRRGLEELALHVETRIGGLENRLINVLQLADDASYDAAFRVRAIVEAGQAADVVNVRQVVASPALKNGLLAIGGALLMAAVSLFFLYQTWNNGLAALFHPGQSVARVGAIPITGIQPGDMAVLLGESLTIVAELDNPGAKLVETTLVLTPTDGKTAAKEQRLTMAAFGSGRQQFRYTLDAVTAPFTYQVEAGGSRSSRYAVTIRERIRVSGLTLRTNPPTYTLLKPSVVEGFKGAIDVPVGTGITLSAQLSAPVAQGVMLLNGKNLPMTGKNDGTRWEIGLTVLEDGEYALAFLDKEGRLLERAPQAAGNEESATAPAPIIHNSKLITQNSPFFPLRAQPDHPPTVKFIQPGQDVSVGVGGNVTLKVSAADDHHLSAVRILWAKSENEPGQPLAALPDNLGSQAKSEAVLDYVWKLDPQAFPDGSSAVFWAETSDDRTLEKVIPGAGPQTSRTPVFKLTVRDEQKLLELRKEMLETLRKELLALLNAQIKARADTVQAAAMSDIPQRATLLTGLVAQQNAILSQADKLGKSPVFEPQLADVQKAVQILATGELPKALDQARTMQQTKNSALVEASQQLRSTQQRVIDVLQTLLGLMPQVVDGKITEPLSKLGADLPADQLDKLKKLKDELNKFIDDQKRVVSTLAPLAKKPVDDYTQEDKLKLEELAQIEDKWDKFMQEKMSDFSKMPEQDFANASLAADIQEIREDVVMAKNALENKTTEIAVPSAQAGGELAEEIVSNLEKWLPNKPDREKWQMEDPTSGQLNIPMAELPKELEDIVGDLLEQEEDLFEEMEDTTAKAADSFDKGAGWDAVDGPIANMTAKGVTGNQLPNNTEMQGRSGEGRSGKSTGEMVEDSAEGKGGRKTPTRLSPDPFQAGQIKDSGKDSTGGATGGGKVSGVTGEGLEGPVAPEMQKEMARLKEKQAQIRNQAEKTAARFGVGSYENFKLREAVRLMSQVEQDLQDYRYHNALRKKDVVLGSLSTAQTLTAARLHVQLDTSPTMSEEVRKDISAAEQGPKPAGYEAEVGQYFQMLSAGE